MSRQLFIFISISLLPTAIYAEKCPPYFGEFECPNGFSCKDNQCYGKDSNPSSNCGYEVFCPMGTVCSDGKCYPVQIVKCNRHVLVGEGQAQSLVSDCGENGRCLNGQCVTDRCLGVSCADGEICRDGACQKLLETFCIGHADCGPAMDCTNNKCTLKNPEPICNCQPHEICHHGQCHPNTKCTSIYCGAGSYCVEGQCVNAIGVDCREDTCHGGTVCLNGVCVVNPCPGRCPLDQDCRMGECRLIEGLPCQFECNGPFICVDGRCRRNDCARRICQLGESCENGACVRVNGRFCTLAARDCGHRFVCKENKCEDTLTVAAPVTTAPQGTNQIA